MRKHAPESWNLFVVFLAGILGHACSGQERPDTRATVHDSAGIQIVENTSARWPLAKAFIVDSSPLVEIGGNEADSTQQLFQVSSVLLMPRGEVLIGNAGSRELLLFDSEGVRLRTIGRGGDGPQEFRAITGLMRCAADTMLVNEFSRLTVFDADLRFIRTITIAPDLAPRPRPVVGIATDCSAIVLAGSNRGTEVRGGVSQEEAFLYWVTMNGTVRDTIAKFPGPEIVQVSHGGNIVPNYRPWGGFPSYATDNERVYIGITNRSEIRQYERGFGLTRIIRWRYDRQRITQEDLNRFDEARRIAVAGDPRAAVLFATIDEFPALPEYKPVFSRILVDDEGRVWVREYPRLAAGRGPSGQWEAEFEGGSQNWWLFDVDGRLLGTVVTPPGLVVLRIERGVIGGIRRGEHDVERVSFHRLLPAPSS